MAGKPALRVLAHPVPPADFLAVLAARTSARGTPFRAGEAHDASSCTLLLQIGLVPAVFPLAHTLVVVAPGMLIANPMGVPNEDRLHSLLLQKAHNLSGRLMPPVAHLPFGASPQPGLGPLEAAKAP